MLIASLIFSLKFSSEMSAYCHFTKALVDLERYWLPRRGTGGRILIFMTQELHFKPTVRSVDDFPGHPEE